MEWLAHLLHFLHNARDGCRDRGAGLAHRLLILADQLCKRWQRLGLAAQQQQEEVVVQDVSADCCVRLLHTDAGTSPHART